jgi:hypothetical protein
MELLQAEKRDIAWQQGQGKSGPGHGVGMLNSGVSANSDFRCDFLKQGQNNLG